jgi:fatty-acyl-CoA synthase
VIRPASSSHSEPHQGLFSVNDPANDISLRECTIGDALRDAARAAPDRIALVDGVADETARGRWTYAALLGIAEQVARALLARFRPGDRIALCAPNCPQWIMLQHGASLAGMVLVPINPAYRKAELGAILQDCDAAALFFQDAWRGNAIGTHAAEIVADAMPALVTVSLGQWDRFLAEGNIGTPLPRVLPGDPAIIQFTSGTTGRPKGAVLCHRGVLNPPRFVAQRVGFPEGGVWINAMPMYHVGGSALTSMATLNLHGTFVLLREWDPALSLRLIEAERGNGMLVVPTMILALLEQPDLHRHDLGSLNFILTGAAAVAPALVDRVRQALRCDLMITFGQTEASGTVSTTARGDGPDELAGTLGRPLPHVAIEIRDPETGARLPCGQAGEIWFRGYQVMLGYYGRADDTRHAITPDGWLRSGDLGTMDDRGYLSICGRLKDLIIRGGMNIYPREIEDILFEHDAVHQVAVIGVDDAKWGEVVVALVQPAPGLDALPLDALHRHCRERLAPHKTPAYWAMVTDLPLTPSGKIQKFVLQDWVRDGRIALVAAPARPVSAISR